MVCSMTNACNVCGKTHGHDTSSLAQFSCGCAASCIDAETDHLPSGPIACFLVDFQPVRQDDCIQAPPQSRMPKTSFDACVLCYINAYLTLLTIGWQLRAGQRRFKTACHALHKMPSLVAVGLLTCVAGKGAVKDRSVVQEVLLQQLWLQCRHVLRRMQEVACMRCCVRTRMLGSARPNSTRARAEILCKAC